MRSIERHRKGDNLNSALELDVLDEAGPGGACGDYRIAYTVPGNTPESDVLWMATPLKFQSGNPAAGINGISNEVLLAVVEDRLSGFAQGPFADQHTIEALRFVTRALKALEIRTQDRIARGVEGQQKQ